MSHEGIRFVSPDEAQAESRDEKKLPADAGTPLKVRVKKSEGTGVEIDWRDGHSSAWNFRWLRDACPCATCNDERQQTGRKPGEPKPRPATLLLMYEDPPRPVEVVPIGKYALKFKWNDGHEAGLYSWDYLRRVCQCSVCRAQNS